MANGYLEFEEAIDVWMLRELGTKNRLICAKYDVDPRRVYEVLECKKHPQSREAAMKRFKQTHPERMKNAKFRIHVPTRKIAKKDDNDDQGTLF